MNGTRAWATAQRTRRFGKDQWERMDPLERLRRIAFANLVNQTGKLDYLEDRVPLGMPLIAATACFCDNFLLRCIVPSYDLEAQTGGQDGRSKKYRHFGAMTGFIREIMQAYRAPGDPNTQIFHFDNSHNKQVKITPVAMTPLHDDDLARMRTMGAANCVHGYNPALTNANTEYYWQNFKISCADAPIEAVTELIHSGAFQGRRLYFKDFDATIDCKGTFKKHEVMDFMVNTLHFAKQNSSKGLRNVQHCVLDNDSEVGENCLSWITTVRHSGRDYVVRLKVYLKLVQELETSAVRSNCGNHIHDWQSANGNRLAQAVQATFEEGLTRAEITVYYDRLPSTRGADGDYHAQCAHFDLAYQNLDPTGNFMETVANKAMEIVPVNLVYKCPHRIMVSNWLKNIKHTLIVYDSTANMGMVCYAYNEVTGKLSNYTVTKNWARLSNFVMQYGSLRDRPVDLISVETGKISTITIPARGDQPVQTKERPVPDQRVPDWLAEKGCKYLWKYKLDAQQRPVLDTNGKKIRIFKSIQRQDKDTTFGSTLAAFFQPLQAQVEEAEAEEEEEEGEEGEDDEASAMGVGAAAGPSNAMPEDWQAQVQANHAVAVQEYAQEAVNDDDDNESVRNGTGIVETEEEEEEEVIEEDDDDDVETESQMTALVSLVRPQTEIEEDTMIVQSVRLMRFRNHAGPDQPMETIFFHKTAAHNFSVPGKAIPSADDFRQRNPEYLNRLALSKNLLVFSGFALAPIEHGGEIVANTDMLPKLICHSFSASAKCTDYDFVQTSTDLGELDLRLILTAQTYAAYREWPKRRRRRGPKFSEWFNPKLERKLLAELEVRIASTLNGFAERQALYATYQEEYGLKAFKEYLNGVSGKSESIRTLEAGDYPVVAIAQRRPMPNSTHHSHTLFLLVPKEVEDEGGEGEENAPDSEPRKELVAFNCTGDFNEMMRQQNERMDSIAHKGRGGIFWFNADGGASTQKHIGVFSRSAYALEREREMGNKRRRVVASDGTTFQGTCIEFKFTLDHGGQSFSFQTDNHGEDEEAGGGDDEEEDAESAPAGGLGGYENTGFEPLTLPTTVAEVKKIKDFQIKFNELEAPVNFRVVSMHWIKPEDNVPRHGNRVDPLLLSVVPIQDGYADPILCWAPKGVKDVAALLTIRKPYLIVTKFKSKDVECAVGRTETDWSAPSRTAYTEVTAIAHNVPAGISRLWIESTKKAEDRNGRPRCVFRATNMQVYRFQDFCDRPKFTLKPGYGIDIVNWKVLTPSQNNGAGSSSDAL